VNKGIAERIRKCVAAESPLGEGIDGAARLKEDAGLDSLSLTAVIVGLEDEFGITFDDGDLDPSAIVTLQDLVGLVKKYV
jgi:acyl carrier protein